MAANKIEVSINVKKAINTWKSVKEDKHIICDNWIKEHIEDIDPKAEYKLKVRKSDKGNVTLHYRETTLRYIMHKTENNEHGITLSAFRDLVEPLWTKEDLKKNRLTVNISMKEVKKE